MSLTNPVGLWGLVSLPVILALHMMRERSRRYVVSSLSLWSFLELEVRGSRPRRFPLTWLLVLHLLIAGFLSLALAQPHLSLSVPLHNARHVVVLLDVSTSMRAREVRPSRFSQAQLEAASLLSGLGPRDVATVITFGTTPRWIGDTRQEEPQELVARVTDLGAGETGHALESALALAVGALSEQVPAEIHVLTDAAFPEPRLDQFPYPIEWHLFGQQVPNQAVLSVSAVVLSRDNLQIFARLGNFGDHGASRVVTLLADGNPVDSISLRMEADTTVSQVWEIVGRPSTVTVLLAGGDHLQEDDTASLGLHLSHRGQEVRVGLVTDFPDPLDRAIRSIPDTDLRLLAPDEYVPGMSFDLVVFRGALPDEWPAGSVLVVDPPTGARLLAVRGLEDITALPIPTADPLLASIDFSGVRWASAWALESVPEPFVPILQAGTLPLLLRRKVGPSQVFLFLPDLSTGNLARHPAFPILIANLVQASSRLPLPACMHTGEVLQLPTADDYPLVRVLPPQGSTVELPASRPPGWERTSDPGIYRLEMVDLDGATHDCSIGFNAGDETESNLSLGDWLSDRKDAEAVAQAEATREINLVPWLLGATVLLLGLEAALAWR